MYLDTCLKLNVKFRLKILKEKLVDKGFTIYSIYENFIMQIRIRQKEGGKKERKDGKKEERKEGKKI